MSEPTSHDLAVRMAELARSVAAPRSAEEIFAEVTKAAVELIPGVDTAGILLITKGGKYESHAGTTDLPHELDELQHMLQEGPCLDAAFDDILAIEDFREETRWPAYSAAVSKLGVLSGLSMRLYTNERTAGALNLFGFEPTQWDSEKRTTGMVLAAHAASAIMSNRQGEQLQSALSTRDRIGQAKGIIMERYGVDDMRAFDMLRRLSQEGNTPLVDIAARVIETRGS
ncbi:GAF and ANTAR domain-containing protein [Mycolicibacterium sp. GCM10028919]|uniref:GAF and ANTAR domain-containing protein n=1 Tax=Mycolicibacterium sp. GCM10028919 TaxID=3273401 RepID=UPI003622AC8A